MAAADCMRQKELTSNKAGCAGNTMYWFDMVFQSHHFLKQRQKYRLAKPAKGVWVDVHATVLKGPTHTSPLQKPGEMEFRILQPCQGFHTLFHLQCLNPRQMEQHLFFPSCDSASMPLPSLSSEHEAAGADRYDFWDTLIVKTQRNDWSKTAQLASSETHPVWTDVSWTLFIERKWFHGGFGFFFFNFF